MKTIFVTVMAIILKVPFWKLLISAVFKVLNNYEVHWQQHLKDTLQLKILLAWINIRVNSFLHNLLKRIWAKMPWKLLVGQKCEPLLWRTLDQDISLTVVFFCLSETNLVFKFNLVLNDYFSPEFVIFTAINFTFLPFYFLILCESWSSSSVSQLFL